MKKIRADIFLINLLLFSLPLIYLKGFGSYNAFKYFYFGTVVLILSVFTAYRFLKNKQIIKSFLKPRYSYGLIAYLVSFIIVSFTSVNPAFSFFSSFSRTDGAFVILYLTLFSLSIYSILALSKDKNKVIKQFITSSVLGAFILSLLIIFSSEGLSVFNWGWLTKSGGGGTTGNQSIAGSYMVWNIFFATILFVKSKTFKKKILPILYFLVMSLSPLFFNWGLLSGKTEYSGLISFIGVARGALIGVIFGFIVFITVWLLLQKNKLRKYLGIVLTTVIIIGSVWGGVTLLNKSSILHQKFIDYTSDGRFVFWDTATEGFKERPLLGWGPNTFSYSYHKFFDPIMLAHKNRSEFLVDKAHNIFFETLNGGGILLFSTLLFFLGSIVWGFVKLSKKNSLTPLESSLFLGALFAWLMQAQFVFDSILSLLMLFLIAGILYGCITHQSEEKKQKVSNLSSKDKFIYFFYIIVVLFLFIYTIVLPFKKNQIMFKTYEVVLPERADLWGSFSDVSPMGDHHDSAILFNNIISSYERSKIKIKNFNQESKNIFLKELDSMINKNYFLIKNTNYYEHIINTIKISYLRMYISNDNKDELFYKTKDLINEAKNFSPKDTQLYWIEAKMEVSKGNFEEAKYLLEKALSIEPRIPYTHALILEFADKSNDKDYYDFALKRAEEMPGILRQIEELKDIN
jgi:O-antigen ligase